MNKRVQSLIIGGVLVSVIYGSGTIINANETNENVSEIVYSNDQGDTVVEQNEYLAMTELNENSDSKLKKMGYSNEDIKDIRNYKENYKENIEYLKGLDNSILEDMEYNSSQIDTIKTFEGTEEEMIRASATVSIGFNGSLSKGSRSNATINMWFNWRGMPSSRGRDILAIYNGEGMYYYADQSYLNIENYDTARGKTHKYNIGATRDGANNKGLSFKFKTYTPYSKTCYTKKGMGRVKLTRAKYINEVGIRVAYGKGNVSLSPSVSFPAGGGISFGNGCKEIKDSFRLIR